MRRPGRVVDVVKARAVRGPGLQRRGPWLALALGLSLAALLRWAVPSPPLFDGLPLPEAPYAYCSPPPNLKSSNQQPGSGQTDFPVQNGVVAGGSVQTDDAAPQVILFIGVDAIKVAPGAVSARVSIVPLCSNPPPPPKGAGIRGNVYRISAVEEPSGRPATIAALYHLTMRVPPGPFNHLQLYDSATWHPLATSLAPGGNPYAGATLTRTGDVAATAIPGGGSPISAVLNWLGSFGVLALVILFGIIALVQEIRRRRDRKQRLRRTG